MRLIDAEKLINEFKYYKGIYNSGAFSYDAIVKIIENQPSVDAVEVVRCKDCKYNGKPYCDLLTTGSRDWYINDNDYCKWGEKE